MGSEPDSGIFLDPWRISTDTGNNLVFHNSSTNKTFKITANGEADPARRAVKVGSPQPRLVGPHTEAQDGIIVGHVHSSYHESSESYVQVTYTGLTVRVSTNGYRNVWDNAFSIPVPAHKKYELSHVLKEDCTSAFYWIPLTA
ncbi:hypothetical protein [Kitasatospora sp. NPDC004531]